MDAEEITKKLKELRANVYDSAHSSEDKSVLQLPDDSMVPLLEDTSGEDVKLERTKGEKVTTPKTLSRTTSMDGGKGADKEIYINDASLKAPTIDDLQNKLDDLKKTHTWYEDESLVRDIKIKLSEFSRTAKDKSIRDFFKKLLNDVKWFEHSLLDGLSMESSRQSSLADKDYAQGQGELESTLGDNAPEWRSGPKM